MLFKLLFISLIWHLTEHYVKILEFQSTVAQNYWYSYFVKTFQKLCKSIKVKTVILNSVGNILCKLGIKCFLWLIADLWYMNVFCGVWQNFRDDLCHIVCGVPSPTYLPAVVSVVMITRYVLSCSTSGK